MPQSQGARLPAPRLHPPHAAKTIQSRMMFSDRLLDMKESERKTKDYIEYILRILLDIISYGKHTVSDASVVLRSMGLYASPEEGALLIRAFIRIKQPELRAAIIDLECVRNSDWPSASS